MGQSRLGYTLYYLMTLNVLHMFFKHQFSSENKESGQDTLYRSLYLFPWSRSRDIQSRNIIDSCWHVVFWRAVLLVWEKSARASTSLSFGGEGSGGLEPQVFRLACLLGIPDDPATEGPQLVLTLTTVITFCKGWTDNKPSQGLRSAEQITGLIQDLRNAEQRYLKLGQGQPYLAARQGFMDWP